MSLSIRNLGSDDFFNTAITAVSVRNTGLVLSAGFANQEISVQNKAPPAALAGEVDGASFSVENQGNPGE